MVLVATQVKRRRGTTAQNDAFTGAEGEITVDTEKHELRVHDGVTQGGHIIPTNETLDFANKALDNLSQEGEARFTNKANSDLSNTPSNVDYVIESQEPTSANGYTWYRKYKSGWVEQGGHALVPATNGLSSSSVTVTLPVPIATPEQATLSYNGMGSAGYYSNCENQASVKTTTVSIGRWNNGNSLAEARYYNWTLSGMSAQ